MSKSSLNTISFTFKSILEMALNSIHSGCDQDLLKNQLKEILTQFQGLDHPDVAGTNGRLKDLSDRLTNGIATGGQLVDLIEDGLSQVNDLDGRVKKKSLKRTLKKKESQMGLDMLLKSEVEEIMPDGVFVSRDQFVELQNTFQQLLKKNEVEVRDLDVVWDKISNLTRVGLKDILMTLGKRWSRLGRNIQIEMHGDLFHVHSDHLKKLIGLLNSILDVVSKKSKVPLYRVHFVGLDNGPEQTIEIFIPSFSWGELKQDFGEWEELFKGMKLAIHQVKNKELLQIAFKSNGKRLPLLQVELAQGSLLVPIDSIGECLFFDESTEFDNVFNVSNNKGQIKYSVGKNSLPMGLRLRSDNGESIILEIADIKERYMLDVEGEATTLQLGKSHVSGQGRVPVLNVRALFKGFTQLQRKAS